MPFFGVEELCILCELLSEEGFYHSATKILSILAFSLWHIVYVLIHTLFVVNLYWYKSTHRKKICKI